MVSADPDPGAHSLSRVARRHAHVYHGDVRVVLGDRGPQRIGVANRGDHVMATIGQDLHQARADHRGVLGDDDRHRRTLRLRQAWDGILTVTTVGPPDGLLMWIVPSTIRSRSASPARPLPASMWALPVPS